MILTCTYRYSFLTMLITLLLSLQADETHITYNITFLSPSASGSSSYTTPGAHITVQQPPTPLSTRLYQKFKQHIISVSLTAVLAMYITHNYYSTIQSGTFGMLCRFQSKSAAWQASMSAISDFFSKQFSTHFFI